MPWSKPAPPTRTRSPKLNGARSQKQQQDLARFRAERADKRELSQQLTRVVHVLEVENHRLKEANADLEQQLAARTGVPDLASRRPARP
ncbi:hypothetical protein [Kutzneria sp. 744]|uniref:hypothetical protein n=1 Tax=Kutzneria sp. (strain 744) TaxID=345341 RepID=UPI0012FB00C7|nr:hypothetical protein [Kutzneria sp. 744]